MALLEKKGCGFGLLMRIAILVESEQKKHYWDPRGARNRGIALQEPSPWAASFILAIDGSPCAFSSTRSIFNFRAALYIMLACLAVIVVVFFFPPPPSAL